MEGSIFSIKHFLLISSNLPTKRTDKNIDGNKSFFSLSKNYHLLSLCMPKYLLIMSIKLSFMYIEIKG